MEGTEIGIHVLLGIHRNDRGTTAPERVHLPIDIAKLPVSVGMLQPFLDLAVDLQRVIHILQQAPHRIGLKGVPQAFNSWAMVRVDFRVHGNRLMGSPAVLSSI